MRWVSRQNLTVKYKKEKMYIRKRKTESHFPGDVCMCGFLCRPMKSQDRFWPSNAKKPIYICKWNSVVPTFSNAFSFWCLSVFTVGLTLKTDLDRQMIKYRCTYVKEILSSRTFRLLVCFLVRSRARTSVTMLVSFSFVVLPVFSASKRLSFRLLVLTGKIGLKFRKFM